MRPRTILPLLVLLSLLAPFAATPAASTPPPRPLCDVCGNGFAEDAHRYGETHGIENETARIAIEHSTATIRVHENGTATWTIRNELASEITARFFRENGTALDGIADSMDDGTLLDARVVGAKTVVLRYRTTGMAAIAPGGILRFDGFRHARGGDISGLGADRLTVVGPPGTVVTRAPRGADVDGNSFSLTSYRDSGDGPFVTFAQSGGVLGETWSFVAVAQALAGIVIRNLFFAVLLPSLSLLALLVGFVWTSSKTVERSDSTFGLVAKIVGALGFLGVAVGITQAIQGDIRYSLVLLVTGGAYLLVALVSRSDARPTTLPRVSATTIGAWATGLVLTGIVAALTDSSFVSRLFELNYYAVYDVLFAGFVSLLLLSLVVVGYAVTDDRYRRAAIAFPSAILGVALLATSSLTRVESLTSLFVFLILGVILLVFVIFVGFPAFLLGRTIPKAESE